MAVRAPQIDLKLLLAQQNPQIDLQLQVYDVSTRNFLSAVANYKNRAISVITERRSAQAAERKRVADRIHQIEAEISQCRVKEIQLLADLEREQEERKESESSVVAFKRQVALLHDKSSAIDLRIEQFRALTGNLRREKNKERSTLSDYATRVPPELRACETRLACVMEGIEKDKLLVRFSHVDKSDIGREFSFVMDISSKAYKALTSTPLLPTLPIFVDVLNSSLDVYTFIKKVRQAFVEMVQ